MNNSGTTTLIQIPWLDRQSLGRPDGNPCWERMLAACTANGGFLTHRKRLNSDILFGQEVGSGS